MNTSEHGIILSIGTQSIYIGTNDSVHSRMEVLDEDSEAFYDYTFNASKQHVEMLKEAYSNKYPHYKVIDLSKNPELLDKP